MGFPQPPMPPAPPNQNNPRQINYPMPRANTNLPPPPPVPFRNNVAQNQNFVYVQPPMRPNFGPYANNQLNYQQPLNTSSNDVASHGPYLSEYDFNKEIDYGDNQYIKDLKTLERFYEDNKYTPILEKRYFDYDIGWKAPRITLPTEELYSRLKYYDDLLSYENLSQEQIIEVRQHMDEIINQLLKRDDYDFYKKFGYERLNYNDNYDLDYNYNSFRNFKYYQREDDTFSWGDTNNYVPVSLPKNKWWIAQQYSFPDDESYFVNFINGYHYPNDLLEHPMFTQLNSYGSFQDLSQEKINNHIIEEWPVQTEVYTYPNVTDQELEQRQNLNVKPQIKLKWYEKIFGPTKKHKEAIRASKEQQNMSNNNPSPSNFPKKENPPPPQPTIMPPKHNPPPPQPTIMPPRPKTPPPPAPGKGFGTGLSQVPTQQYFNTQQR